MEQDGTTDYEVWNKKSKQASKTYLVVGITTTILNFVYLTTAVLYKRNSIPPIHLPECTAISDSDCIPSSIYKDEFASFVIKILVFLIAIITELLVAIKPKYKPHCQRQNCAVANVTKGCRSSYSGALLCSYRYG